jgi:hypothetical protein
MKKTLINTDPEKSKSLVVLEHILLFVCLSIVALRATIIEGPAMRAPSSPTNLTDPIYSLSLSAILILAFIIWLVWSLCSKTFLYRITGIEIGLCIFGVASVLSGLAASDKRLAITDIAMMLAPIFAAILLIQTLDTPAKVRLVLSVIAALGVVCAYQAAEQFFISNQMTIEQYEKDPNVLLKPLGIEPGTFKHFLFVHRLYSRGVRGFFTTRNSAGSFLLMAFFASLGLFIEQLRKQKTKSFITHLLARGLVAAIIIFALTLTRSKGAFIGLLFALVVFIASIRYSNWLIAHKKLIILICLVTLITVTYAITSYGLKYNRLPGGNSMFVRWQYWRAAAQMYADHPVRGVGPGNFAYYYTRYKPASALESVANPHNFPLSVLTQYGPIGLIGFMAMFFVPIWKASSIRPLSSSIKSNQQRQLLKHPTVTFMLAISAVLLLLRPPLMPRTPMDNVDLMIYIIVTQYVAPVAAFVIGFFLLTVPLDLTQTTKQKTHSTSTVTIVCSCAIVAVLIHNLIDFAIFEPGVYTVLLVTIACLIAAHHQHNSIPARALIPSLSTKAIAVTALSIFVVAYYYFAWWPVYKSTTNINKAHHAISRGQFEQAHGLLSTAAKDDLLSPAALDLDGRVYLRQYAQSERKQIALLKKAELFLLQTIKRNKADFKNYERLVTVYDLLGEHQKAYEVGHKAIKLYPGSGRLRFNIAQIAEKLGKADIALVQYRAAVRIEDSFRRQFHQMYPERKETVSRLGQDKYEFALQRIEKLESNL